MKFNIYTNFARLMAPTIFASVTIIMLLGARYGLDSIHADLHNSIVQLTQISDQIRGNADLKKALKFNCDSFEQCDAIILDLESILSLFAVLVALLYIFIVVINAALLHKRSERTGKM